MALVAIPGFAAPASSASKKKPYPNKASRAKTVARKPVVTGHRRPARSSKKPAAGRSYRRSTQHQPTHERYQEIQQALADKGYFNGAADGNWGPPSVEALKRFQRDQNLTQDGKIGSLSLIALGLGPKRVAIAKAPPRNPDPQP